MSLSVQCFLIKFLKFLAIYFDVVTSIVSIPGMATDDLNYFKNKIIKKIWVQRPPVYSKMLRKICKKEA